MQMVLYGVTKHNTNRIQLVQNAAARLITKSPRKEHITPILKQLHWLPIYHRIRYKILVTCFKCLHGQGPDYLTELLVHYSPSRTLRSSDSNLLLVPRTTSSFGERRFGVCAPKEWNKLPYSIRNCDNINIFKTSVKTLLFKEHYN